ncbi:MAG TPA: glutathione peroxidase [Elusimicrobiota bacterium]|nr:glutathione peroxidase [Elusimicrobiota bacterium]
MGKVAETGKIYAVEAKGIDGASGPLARYKGQVLLIVNVASRCGFTPQYHALEALSKRYRDRGLRVLGFPCNQFGAQEPESEPKIMEFCSLNYGVTFDLFSKVEVNGPGAHPLYRLLTKESGFDGDIEWNFTKFLVDREGKVRARFEPDEDPLSAKLTGQVEALLG